MWVSLGRTATMWFITPYFPISAFIYPPDFCRCWEFVVPTRRHITKDFIAEKKVQVFAFKHALKLKIILKHTCSEIWGETFYIPLQHFQREQWAVWEKCIRCSQSACHALSAAIKRASATNIQPDLGGTHIFICTGSRLKMTLSMIIPHFTIKEGISDI